MSVDVAPNLLNLQNETEAQYDATVRADIELFRSYAEKYMAGGLTDDEFRAQRLRRGIYSQRQAGVHMIRTKIPGGSMTAAQMDQLAVIADEFCGGKGHLTTRQNIQYHFVPLPQVSDLRINWPISGSPRARPATPRSATSPLVRSAASWPTKCSTCILTRRRSRSRSCTKSSPIACRASSRLHSQAVRKTA